MSKEYFEALKNSRDYDQQLHLKLRVLKTFESLIQTFYNKKMQKDDRFLDLGSSDGALVEVAKQRGYKAVGLDIDSCNFETDKIRLENQSCDIISAISLIEHMYSPYNLINEVRRLLKKNGFFIIVTPNWSENIKVFFDDPTHIHPYTKTSLRKLLEGAKFKNIRIVPWLVCKPAWMWKVPFSFTLAKILPFRGDSSKIIPKLLKGKSKTLLAICTK